MDNKKNQNANKSTSTFQELLTNYKVYLAIIAVLLLIIVLLLKDRYAAAPSPQPEQPVQDASANEQDPEQGGEETPAQEPEAEPDNKLEENRHGSIDLLIQRYCNYIASGDVEALEEIVDVLTEEEKESIRTRAAFIESFDNISCFTKDGPVEDSFIVFACYDMKLINIETSAPDIICLYVGPDEGEGRRIHYGTVDEGMQDYVAQLEQDPEVKALYDDVSARYQAAQESDETLAAFVQKITGQVAETETVPEETPSEEPEEAPQEEEPQEPEPEAPAESQTATAQNRQTRVSETVNVRTEQSTESARVTLAYQGDEITQIESYENGWSKVEYKGQSGYVMTEYLE